MATTKLMTAEELLALPDDGQRHELIDGELRTMAPTGDEHGGIVAALTGSLHPHVRAHGLGRVRAGEPGFRLRRDPDTVRAPDVAFIGLERVRGARKVAGYREGAPDLAVEVISPDDLYTEVDAKVAMWFEYGAQMVIVINPCRRVVSVYRSPTQVRILTEADVLDGEDVVPGWTMPVADIFENEDDMMHDD